MNPLLVRSQLIRSGEPLPFIIVASKNGTILLQDVQVNGFHVTIEIAGATEFLVAVVPKTEGTVLCVPVVWIVNRKSSGGSEMCVLAYGFEVDGLPVAEEGGRVGEYA